MGESSFWYRPTRVVPDQRPLNGRCCCCCCCVFFYTLEPSPHVTQPAYNTVSEFLVCPESLPLHELFYFSCSSHSSCCCSCCCSCSSRSGVSLCVALSVSSWSVLSRCHYMKCSTSVQSVISDTASVQHRGLPYATP